MGCKIERRTHVTGRSTSKKMPLDLGGKAQETVDLESLVHGKSYTTQLTQRLAIASSRTKLKCGSMQLKTNMTRLALLSFLFRLAGK